MNIYLNLFLSALILVFTGPAFATVETGMKMPHALEAKDHNGDVQNFQSLKGPEGVVLVFIRSADWCPYCQAQLIELGQNAAAITERDYALITISYDDVETLKKFHMKHDLSYAMLSDSGSDIIRSFGILNEDIPPESAYYGIPHPAIFIVDEEGIVQHILREKEYKKRPKPADIVRAIEARQ